MGRAVRAKALPDLEAVGGRSRHVDTALVDAQVPIKVVGCTAEHCRWSHGLMDGASPSATLGYIPHGVAACWRQNRP